MTNTADGTPLPVDSDYTWADLPTVRPSIEECKKVIQKWDSSAPRPFAGMPRPSDIDFDKRFQWRLTGGAKGQNTPLSFSGGGIAPP